MSWNNQSGGNGSGPWGKRPGDNNQGPWGQGGGNRNQGNSEFDEMLKAFDKFFGRFGGSSNGGGGRVFMSLVVIGILLVWLSSGFYRVQPDEHGVILRFGEWSRTQTEPGLGYHLPWPVETVYTPNVTFQRRIEVGFRGNISTARRNQVTYSSVKDIPQESLMLTGDENIIDIDFVVVWSVKDAKDFLFNVRDPEGTIKKVAESTMREVIGQTDIQPALTQARTNIEDRTKDLMQKSLNSYMAGVAIEKIQLQKVDPPEAVVDAFNEVQRARADRERLRNEAEAYRNDILPKARGRAEELFQQAEAYREKVVSEAEGDAERFLSIYKAYSKAKDVTAKRLYLETMEEIFEQSNKYIVDDKIGGSGLVPYLPVNNNVKTKK